ncbi:MAG: hypothetical protein ACPG3X_08355 [Opitutales bacterium]
MALGKYIVLHIVSLCGPLIALGAFSAASNSYRESMQEHGPMDTSGLDPVVAGILQNYYELNFNGPRNWASVESIRYDGLLHLSQGSVRFIAFKKKPDYSKVVILAGNGARVVMSYDGVDAWQLNTLEADAEPTAMPPAEASNFIRDAAFGGCLLYPRIEGKSFNLLGTIEVNGDPCYELEITLPDGQRIRSALDLDQFAERRQITFNAVSGAEEQNVHYAFRQVEGIRFPVNSAMEVGGEAVHRIEILDIQLNTGATPWMFSRPAGAYLPGRAAPNDSAIGRLSDVVDPEGGLPFGSTGSFGEAETRFPDFSPEEQKSLLDDIGQGLYR